MAARALRDGPLPLPDLRSETQTLNGNLDHIWTRTMQSGKERATRGRLGLWDLLNFTGWVCVGLAGLQISHTFSSDPRFFFGWLLASAVIGEATRSLAARFLWNDAMLGCGCGGSVGLILGVIAFCRIYAFDDH